MKAIIGLGNPGEKYIRTRHNIGFMTVDELARRHEIRVNKIKYRSLYGQGSVADVSCALVKPLTYMNHSGLAVADLIDGLGVKPQDLIIIYDDLDLEPGTIRVRRSGSSGGHRGIESIIYQLATEDIPRVRIGIGRPQDDDAVSYVLNEFADDERDVMAEAVRAAADAVESVLAEGLGKTMSHYNARDRE